MHIPVCFSQQKAPAHSEHRLYGCTYIGMQLLGFDAKFLKGFLVELKHLQLNVRLEILTLRVKKEPSTFKRKYKSFNISKIKNLQPLK